MKTIKSDKSIIVDECIQTRIDLMHSMNAHALKIDGIIYLASRAIDLSDEDPVRQEIIMVGIKQVIYTRLNAMDYHFVRRGICVNIYECSDIEYLNEIMNNKENNVRSREAAIKRIKEIRESKLNGQIEFDGDMNIVVPMNEDEFMERLEADAV